MAISSSNSLSIVDALNEFFNNLVNYLRLIIIGKVSSIVYGCDRELFVGLHGGHGDLIFLDFFLDVLLFCLSELRKIFP